MIIVGQNGLRLRARMALLVALTIAATIAVPTSASAQGFFDALFGRRSGPGSSASAYADPFGWFGRPQEAPRAEIGSGSDAYCVRVCDGRFFPITRHQNVNPAQACSSFCPAAQTKVYNGSSIEHAVGSDGRRYSELATAFAYREKIVPGCTCNGKDAFGLVNTPLDDDATLRPGDIVATNKGLMAYNGGRNKSASYTPVGSYSGLSADVRRKLTETKIEPVAATPAPVVAPPETTGSTRGSRNRRAQSDR